MGELPTPVASAGPETTGVFFSPPGSQSASRATPMIPLLVLALADPLPAPVGPTPAADEPEAVELAPVEPRLTDDRYSFGLGLTVAAGAYKLDDGWVAAASLAVDLIADFGRFELVLSPHALVHVGNDIAGLFGFEGQAVIALNEFFAISAGTEQLISVSRYQTGALRFGPSFRPFIARMGLHHLSLQIAWLPVGAYERDWRSCASCNERPEPYYTLGYGVLF